MNKENLAFVRTESSPTLPPPASTSGITGWLWQNIFSSMMNFTSLGSAISSILMTILTVGCLYYGLSFIVEMITFMFFDATWSDPEGIKREACRPNHGACWPFVWTKMKLVLYGPYPMEELWRVNLVYALLAIGIIWMVFEKLPYRNIIGISMLTIFPLVAFILLSGGNVEINYLTWIIIGAISIGLLAAGIFGADGRAGKVLEAFSGGLVFTGALFLILTITAFLISIDYGLPYVETSLWGGFMVTLVVALTGIVASLPLGILLALGRQSSLPAIKIISVAFIEFWRGVPLITVLFMSSVMLPLFLPEGTTFDKLLRALIGVALFSAAYMAEVIRGGLQALPKGQYEGAMALGLSYWQMMRLIILPQALTTVIPGIVNTFIGLFKDTTLVLIIGIFDLLGIVEAAKRDAAWATPVTSHTGYLIAAIIFWVCCFGMSRYSMYMEEKLNAGRRH